MNAVARQDQIAVLDAQLTRESQIEQFRAALPKHIPWQRFVRVVRTGAYNNPELLDAHRGSYLNACMRAAQDGLLPDGRLGALVIYQGKGGTKMVQWLPMIAGLRQKVRNSGEITEWSAHVVHERDAWDYQEGDNPHIHHRPVRGDRGPVVAAYSVARYRTGEISREWMWIEELDKVRAASKAQRGPWQDWTEEMYKKTVAKRHSKVLPMSSDLDDLLRRPDEPESGPGEVGGVTSPAVMPGQAAPPAALTEALDALTDRTAKQRHADPDHEIDGDTGEVIDAGEYADSDTEEVPQERTGMPQEAAASRKAVGGP
jgi:recombination protein RecT